MPDVNGLWSGEYRYEKLPIIVKFTAAIRQNGTTVTGTTFEENMLVETGPPELTAALRGEHVGNDIRFTKIYSPKAGLDLPPLLYQGKTDENCAFISGHWDFGDQKKHVRGTFTMTRVSDRAGRGAAAAQLKLPPSD